VIFGMMKEGESGVSQTVRVRMEEVGVVVGVVVHTKGNQALHLKSFFNNFLWPQA
jgi:hypothetical protein